MKKVTIDPGHAPGNANRGPTGYYEYAGMWKLSNYLKEALTRCGISAELTRKESENPSLSQRGSRAKGSDVFISEHSNAANGQARGAEVYYSVRIPGDKKWAGKMSAAVAKVMDNNNRGAKTREHPTLKGQDYYGVIRSAVAAGVPHVFLAESGFHDNPIDEAFLKVDSNLEKIAEVQCEIICELLKVEYVGKNAFLVLYRVRKSANDASSQIGAYRVLENAKAEADKNEGYKVFNQDGKLVYDPTKPEQEERYIVQKGDTLNGIASRFGIELDELVKRNNIKDPNLIYPGQEIILREAPEGPEKGEGPDTSNLTPIIGESEATREQAREWLKQVAPDWVLMADLFFSIAPKYGVRADIALAQACKETGYFRFGGLVKPWQNNFAGIGATGQASDGNTPLRGADPGKVRFEKGAHGAIFDDRATGVEAQIQHLFAYATEAKLPENITLYSPRFQLVRRGSAKYVEHLGAGENPEGVGWAYPGDDYGKSIIKDYLEKLLLVEVDEGSIKVEELQKEVSRLESKVKTLKTVLQDIGSYVKEKVSKGVN